MARFPIHFGVNIRAVHFQIFNLFSGLVFRGMKTVVSTQLFDGKNYFAHLEASHKQHISDKVLFAILNCVRSDEKSHFKKIIKHNKNIEPNYSKTSWKYIFSLYIPCFEQQVMFLKIS